jgi:hypothetical protein
MVTYSIKRDLVEVGRIFKNELYGVIVYHVSTTLPHRGYKARLF